MKSREEHVAWCKQRALAYVERNDPENALASLLSDITKHPETNIPALSIRLTDEAFPLVFQGDLVALRKFIEDFA